VIPRSLVWATSIDVLAPDRVVERRDDHLVVRSPSSPAFYWGNLLVFDEPPKPGDGARWERLFEEAFGDDPRVRHVTLGWDVPDGPEGAARGEFLTRGYTLETSVGLVAEPADLHPHPRASSDVTVRALDPDGDEALWRQVIEVQVAGRGEAHDEAGYRTYSIDQQNVLRGLLRAGRGSWYVALDDDLVVGTLGIVVTDGRARYQAVDTLGSHRRRGVSSRLVVEAAEHAAREHAAERFVIVADANYHALGLYESLGFRPAERVLGVCRIPRSGSAR
jgi:ribosomal protein S18 acetylase RimI-like enzyme